MVFNTPLKILLISCKLKMIDKSCHLASQAWIITKNGCNKEKWFTTWFWTNFYPRISQVLLKVNKIIWCTTKLFLESNQDWNFAEEIVNLWTSCRLAMQVNELLRLCIQVWKYNLSGQERKQKQTNKQADDYFDLAALKSTYFGSFLCSSSLRK